MVDNAYNVKWRIEPIEVNLGYGRRGRSGKGDSPRIVTEYRVDVDLSFNEGRAVTLSKDRGVRVLVTNLPRSTQDRDNIRSGATADTVLKTYLGQSCIEHAFRIMKDGMSMDRVYLHRPSRENAMMFVISLATMMSDIIHHVLVSEGIDHTAEDLAGRMTTLTLVHNREQDEETLDGPEALQSLFIDCIEVMRIDSNHIIH